MMKHLRYARGGNRRSYSSEKRSQLMAKWVLRALLDLGGHKKFINQRGYQDNDILNIVGLHHLADADKIKRKSAKKILEQRLDKVEGIIEPLINDTLTKNIAWLTKTLTLSSEEKLILLYAVLTSNIRDLACGLNTVSNVDKSVLIKSLSSILDISLDKVKYALSHKGTLINSGLIKIKHDESYLGDKLEIINGLNEALFTEHEHQQDILNRFFIKSDSAKLTLDDFQHIQEDYSLLSSYLNEATKRQTKGVNILIHGTPGVGKTEFVKMLTSELNLNLFEITMKDEDDDPVSGSQRFPIYQLSQRLLENQSDCIILFDEIEDVFPSSGDSFLSMLGGESGNKSGKKAWINHLLENNKTPTFWLSNKIYQIDKAYLRRFDYVMELRQPNRTGRKRIINKYLDQFNMSKHWINTLSENENVAPSFIEKAAKVADHISAQGSHDVERSLNKVIGNTLEIFGHKKIHYSSNETNIDYSSDYLNTDHNINEICEGLKQFGSGRLCLFGPPGTGKTALGHHIAEYVDKPLIVKSGSDILSMWVGGTEKNISNMFRQATEENAVLLLDEADSFIQSRESAKQSWEITQVNELLLQMENFKGIFIASTNLIEILDTASLRRFDFKVKFDYLKNTSALNIFNQIMGKEGWNQSISDKEVLSRISAISNLALGDYAVAVRKMRFSKDKTNHEFLSHLEGESKLKPESSTNTIGFSANIH